MTTTTAPAPSPTTTASSTPVYYSTEARLTAEHPGSTDRRDLPKIRREWQGRRVAVRYRQQRGHSYRRTLMGWAWGTLVEATRDDQIAVRTKHGHKDIHYTRVCGVWDLSRRLTPTRARTAKNTKG